MDLCDSIAQSIFQWTLRQKELIILNMSQLQCLILGKNRSQEIHSCNKSSAGIEIKNLHPIYKIQL